MVQIGTPTPYVAPEREVVLKPNEYVEPLKPLLAIDVVIPITFALEDADAEKLKVQNAARYLHFSAREDSREVNEKDKTVTVNFRIRPERKGGKRTPKGEKPAETSPAE